MHLLYGWGGGCAEAGSKCWDSKGGGTRFVTVVMLMLMCAHNTLCKSGLSVFIFIFIFIQLHVPCFIDTDCCSRQCSPQYRCLYMLLSINCDHPRGGGGVFADKGQVKLVSPHQLPCEGHHSTAQESVKWYCPRSTSQGFK